MDQARTIQSPKLLRVDRVPSRAAGGHALAGSSYHRRGSAEIYLRRLPDVVRPDQFGNQPFMPRPRAISFRHGHPHFQIRQAPLQFLQFFNIVEVAGAVHTEAEND